MTARDWRRMLRRKHADRWLDASGWRPSVDEEVDEELAFHLAMRVRDLQARGLDEEAARAEAARRFGNLAAVADTCRTIGRRRDHAMRRAELWQGVVQDVRYAVRTLARQPLFTAVAVLTLALGIGASTAIFSVVRGVLLRPLPFAAPDRLVRIWPLNTLKGDERGALAVPDIADWRERNTVFSSLAAYAFSTNGPVLTGVGEPARLRTAYIDRGFFQTLGARAELGRVTLPEEHVDGKDHVVVLSDGVWRSRFGADPRIIGRTITLDGEPFTVVGVMPPEVRFPAPDAEVWVPITTVPPSAIPRERGVRWLSVVARLKPGVTLAQANADMRAVARHLAEEYPEADASFASAAVVPLREAIVGNVRTALLVLFASVVVIVLIACVNVANLLLVRATARGREFAVRAALGGTRARLVRQVLTESLVLALGGGILGVALAWWGQGVLVRLSGDYLPRAADVHVDGTVLGFAFLVSLLTGAAFGLVPALRLGGGPLSGAMREGGRSGSAAAGTLRLRSALVVLEVALAVTLVAGAGLMVRSFSRLVRVDPGFDTQHTLLADFMLPRLPHDTPALMNARVREIVAAVRAVPGITSASEIKEAPLHGEGEPAPFTIPGRATPRAGEEPRAETLPVGAGYFATMGIPLLSGRDFLPSDTTRGAPVLVVNRAFARRWFPGERAVGQRVRLLGADFAVIGVAGDVRTFRLDSVAHPTVYVPREYMPRAVVTLVARTPGDPARMVSAVRSAIHGVAPGLPISEIVPMRQVVSDAVAAPRFLTVLISLFGVLALVLAVVGLYGVVSFIVGQRANEIGIRMALGARANEVVWLMLRRGMAPVLVGAAVGLGVALLATRLMRSLLFQVSATDPLTFAAITLLLLAAAFVAALVPARRAARIDPMTTLRQE